MFTTNFFSALRRPVRYLSRWLRLARSQFHRELASGRGGKRIPHNLVVSAGGTATTTVMQFLGTYLELNDPGDKDGLKHIPSAGFLDRSADVRVLFILGDLDRAAQSLIGRGIMRQQLVKLGGIRFLFASRKSWSKDYVALAERQLGSFQESELDVMFLAFNNLFESYPQIAEFFDLPSSAAVHFPKRRNRRH